MLRPRQFWLWSNLNKPAVSIIGSEVFIFRDATMLSLPQEQHIGFNICRITLAVNKTKSYEEAVETSHILTHSSSSKFRCPLFVQYERASTEAAQTASGASTQIAATPNYSVSSSSTNPSSPTDPRTENSSTTHIPTSSTPITTQDPTSPTAKPNLVYQQLGTNFAASETSC